MNLKTIKCSECKKEYDSKLKACSHCGYVNKKRKILQIIFYVVTIVLFTISILSLLKHIYINNFLNGLNKFVIDTVDEKFADNINTITEAYQLGNYPEKYSSKEFGIKAYNLNNFRVWSMSFCIVFIWFGIYLQHKNIKFGRWIKYIAIVVFIICQLVPLGFALSVRNKSIEDTNTITTNNYVNNSVFIPLKEN